MERIRRTLDLAKASWTVLKADKELIALPVFSFIASAIVAATFLIPTLGDVQSESLTGAQYGILAITYLVLTFITIFFNSALVHAANERMDGGDPTIGSAIRGALLKIGRIAQWALVAATVSQLIRMFQERAGILGRIIGSIAGIAWTLVTFLVIPVLVIEDIGVVDAVKRSGRLFKQTWGENVTAQVGFGLLGFVAALPALAAIALGVAAGGALAGVLIIAGVAWILAAAMVIAALNGVFQTALYRHAASLELPAVGFGDAQLHGAFAPKQ